MSDDLISRKVVLKELREITDEPHNTMFLMGIGAAISVIEHADTAFDKEKVIEELKSAIGDIHYTEDGSFNGKCIEDFEFIQAKTALDLSRKAGSNEYKRNIS